MRSPVSLGHENGTIAAGNVRHYSLVTQSRGTQASSASFPPVVWPPRVRRPQRPPALVYLDLNHFICLARIAIGDPVPRGYESLIEPCGAAGRHGRAHFPLSETH